MWLATPVRKTPLRAPLQLGSYQRLVPDYSRFKDRFVETVPPRVREVEAGGLNVEGIVTPSKNS